MKRDKGPHELAKHVAEILLLERHVRIPFDMQRRDADFANVHSALQLVCRLSATSGDHILYLKQCLDDLGGEEATGIDSTYTDIVAFFAGSVDKSRKSKVSNGLRDDYASIALCAAGYAALITAANAMGESFVALGAEGLLEDYAELIVDIARVLPEVIVQELTAFGLDAGDAIAAASTLQIERALQIRSRVQESSATSTRGTIDATDKAR